MTQYERSSATSAESNGTSSTFGPAMPSAAFAAANSTAHSMMRGQMAVLSLASRRARAQMEFPKQAMACRSASEIGQLGSEFWRTAFQDYMDCNRQIANLWMQSFSAVGQLGPLAPAFNEAGKVFEESASAVQQAGAEMVEHPTEPWAWWRTDMKGLKPSRNGHSREEGARAEQP